MNILQRWLKVTLLLCSVFVIVISTIVWPPRAEAAHGDGVLFYAAPTNTTPQTKAYSVQPNTFGTATGTVAGTQATIVQMKMSPFKDERIAGYEDASGNLQIMCFNGSSWSNEWSIAVGGTGTTRRFDIAFETSTGDVTVAYSRNTAAVNALAYRTKLGSTGCGAANWAAATNFPTTTSTTTGIVQWVKAARDGRGTSSLDTFIWADANSDLGASVWSGTAFANFKLLETTLEVITAAQDIDDFDVQYESVSGDVMTVWADTAGNSNNTQGAFYATCTGGTATCTWLTTPAKISTATGDDATNLDLSSDPLSDKMSFASVGNQQSDMQAAYWSGTAWTFYANLDTAIEDPVAGTRLVQTAWVSDGANTRWVATFDDATGTGISWIAATPGSAPVVQTDFTSSPAINDVRQRYQMDSNPFNNSETMLVLTDSTKTIIAERLTLTGTTLAWANASASVGLGTTNVVPAEGFVFQYSRYVPPGSLSGDIVDGSGVTVGSPAAALSGVASSTSCQTTTGTLGISSQKIRVSNTTINPAWTVSIAATSGATSNWSSGTATYDFNDPTTSGCGDGADADSLSGQLSINPAVGTLTPNTFCSNTGLTLGSSSSFNQGTVDSISLVTAATTADIDCLWDLTGVALSQKIPALQPGGSYSLNLTITTVAN